MDTTTIYPSNTSITTVHSLGGSTYGIFHGMNLVAFVEEIAGGLFCDRCAGSQTCEHCVSVARGLSAGTVTSLWVETLEPTPPTTYYYKGIPHYFVQSRDGERMYAISVEHGIARHVYDVDTSPADRCIGADYGRWCWHMQVALDEYEAAMGMAA